MMKWMKGRQSSDSYGPSTCHSTPNQSAFAHFAGINPMSSQSGICCSVINNCLSSWIIDTGASDHMTFNQNLLTKTTKPSKHILVTLPDGTSKPVLQTGQVTLAPNFNLQNVLYVPDFRFNLLSVSQLVSHNNLCVIFFSDTCIFQDLTTNKIVAVAPKQGGLYKLDPLALGKTKGKFPITPNSKPVAVYSSKYMTTPSLDSFSANNVVCNSSFFDVLHARLGHTSLSKMRHIPDCKSHISNNFFCEICALAKSHRLPFNKSSITTQSPFQLVHMDLWGPYRTANVTGAHYFLTLVDDFSRNTWTQLLHSKNQVASTLIQFYNMIETQFQKKILMFRTDNGTKFINCTCLDFFKAKGVLLQRSMVKNPQQNGVAERKHRHLLDTARAIKFQAGFPKTFWGECVLSATHIINLLPM